MKQPAARALLAVVAFLALAPPLAAAEERPADAPPLRSGTILSKVDADVFTYFKAVDAAGKEFWVITSICTIGEKGTIEVLSGGHYKKVRSRHLDADLEDVYTALLLRIAGQEVTGFGAHGLPESCVILE